MITATCLLVGMVTDWVSSGDQGTLAKKECDYKLKGNLKSVWGHSMLMDCRKRGLWGQYIPEWKAPPL